MCLGRVALLTRWVQSLIVGPWIDTCLRVHAPTPRTGTKKETAEKPRPEGSGEVAHTPRREVPTVLLDPLLCPSSQIPTLCHFDAIRTVIEACVVQMDMKT